MAERDEGTTLDPDDAPARRDGGAGEVAGDEQTSVDRAVATARHGIDQIADKVKGILRSDR